MKTNRLQDRIFRAFALQGFLIALAVVLGILLTNWLLSRLLVQEALERETAHYWQLIDNHPAAQLSNSLNLRGYLLPRDADQFPAGLDSQLANGYHEVSAGSFNALYVSTRDGNRMYLLFNRSGVKSLISLYGLVPLAVVLSLLYLVLWFSYLRARRAVSPTIELARILAELPEEFVEGELEGKLPENLDTDVAVLADAIERYRARIALFVARERAFSRDASHELRTPITVISMSAELMAANGQLSEQDARQLDRIQRACHDMEELTDAFLALSRERDGNPRSQQFDVADVIEKELQSVVPVAREKGIGLYMEGSNALELHANQRVVGILLGNLIRNAVKYTDAGRVRVRVQGDVVQVIDSGTGISAEQLSSIYDPHVRDSEQSRSGYGVGLAIVKRLCEQNGWQVSLSSKKGHGTSASLTFTDGAVRQQPDYFKVLVAEPEPLSQDRN
ncbi:sensor histidine kinase [Biformimicrobium ophioploci]|uniref:histidine kinase n=1 Tax=Biformimicrobium ophioploci TaxID=3036711 RepID=A0ABQ6LVD9_9GAMM|nr:HAMP domain-containing sensor histidine kinase [Microbulbifer sp. NKW57]GMG86050.1 HAMP domain-containing sensor histidine kinase [Microbulbifer sp. NKW57]